MELFVNYGDDEQIVFTDNKRIEKKDDIIINNTWFSKIFGFLENTDFPIKDVISKFTLVKNYNLINCVNKVQSGNIKFENIVCDIKSLYNDKKNCENSLFCVYTNINFCHDEENKKCLLTDYKDEQMIYTPYTSFELIYNEQQHNSMKDFMDFIKNYDNTINYTVENGYLRFGNSLDLQKAYNVLKYDMTRRREVRKHLVSLVRNNNVIHIDGINKEHTVNHIYCHSLQINNKNDDLDKTILKGLYELVLEGMYENILFHAYVSGYKTCYLVPLGNNALQIARAIQRACHVASLKGIDMDVKLIHNNLNYDCKYNEICEKYPMKKVFVNSVWD